MAVSEKKIGPQYYVANRTHLQMGGDNGKKALTYQQIKEFEFGEEVAVKSVDGKVSLVVAVRSPRRPEINDRNILQVQFDGDLGPDHAKRIRILNQNAPSGYSLLERDAPKLSSVYEQEPILDLVQIETNLYGGGVITTVVAMVYRGHSLMTPERYLEEFGSKRNITG